MGFIYAGILLVAGSILMLEVALTRVFAIMMWHHLAYMVVSMALVGFGAAGSILTAARQGLRDEHPSRPLALMTAAYGASVMFAFFVATLIPVDALEVWTNKYNLLLLGLVYLVVILPFLLGGAVIGLALSRLSEFVSTLYFFDLIGSALGGAMSVWLLAELGSTATVMVCGVVGLAASGVFALACSMRLCLAIAPFAAVSGLAFVGFAGGSEPLRFPALDWDVPYAQGKEIRTYLEYVPGEEGSSPDPIWKASRIETPVTIQKLHSATAEVEVTAPVTTFPMMGGEFAKRDRRRVELRVVAQDGAAPTLLIKGAGDIDAFDFLDDAQAGVAYVAHRARGGEGPEVMVIGVGGGVDVMMGLAYGASRVTAVDVNQAMIEALTTRYDDYLGGLFQKGRHPVELFRADGRSFVRSRSGRYDVITLNGVDTFTALNAGAYTLSESYLYTVEAVKDFYLHLKEGGYLSYSRFIMVPPKKARETLRLANIALTALQELGVADPSARIAVFRGERWATTLIKRGAFTEPEIAAVRRFAVEREFAGLVYDPLSAHASLTEPGAERSDTAPYSWEQVARDFATVLRGSASERRAFIDGYEYDVTPVTDDAPFFFNYYRYRGLLRALDHDEDGAISVYQSDFPVGHAVLLLSLVQITVLATLLILLPLRFLSRAGVTSSGRSRVFGYFAALGAGFITIEIVFMQKLVLFLGHPTYAISVVLTSMLAFAGLGSLLAGRVSRLGSRRWALLGGVIAGLVLVDVAVVEKVLPSLLGAGFEARVAVVVLLLAPLGIALGFPFPMGIRVVRHRCPELVPWAWAINGFLSVFAGIFCIVVAIEVGFSAVLMAAAALYVVGMVVMMIGGFGDVPAGTRGSS